MQIDHVQVPLSLPFKVSLSAKFLFWVISSNFNMNEKKTVIHNKDFTRRLAVKVRLK